MFYDHLSAPILSGPPRDLDVVFRGAVLIGPCDVGVLLLLEGISRYLADITDSICRRHKCIAVLPYALRIRIKLD